MQRLWEFCRQVDHPPSLGTVYDLFLCEPSAVKASIQSDGRFALSDDGYVMLVDLLPLEDASAVPTSKRSRSGESQADAAQAQLVLAQPFCGPPGFDTEFHDALFSILTGRSGDPIEQYSTDGYFSIRSPELRVLLAENHTPQFFRDLNKFDYTKRVIYHGDGTGFYVAATFGHRPDQLGWVPAEPVFIAQEPRHLYCMVREEDEEFMNKKGASLVPMYDDYFLFLSYKPPGYLRTYALTKLALRGATYYRTPLMHEKVFLVKLAGNRLCCERGLSLVSR